MLLLETDPICGRTAYLENELADPGLEELGLSEGSANSIA